MLSGFWSQKISHKVICDLIYDKQVALLTCVDLSEEKKPQYPEKNPGSTG